MVWIELALLVANLVRVIINISKGCIFSSISGMFTISPIISNSLFWVAMHSLYFYNIIRLVIWLFLFNFLNIIIFVVFGCIVELYPSSKLFQTRFILILKTLFGLIGVIGFFGGFAKEYLVCLQNIFEGLVDFGGEKDNGV